MIQFDPNKIRQTIGRYRLTRLLGRGTVGTVYRAQDLRTRQAVAIKVLYHVFNRETLLRFKNEVRTMRGLHHPNIVRALSGTLRRCSVNYYYFPMELVEGYSLEWYLTHQSTMRGGTLVLKQLIDRRGKRM
jgi:serine/threonine protein kinase